MGRQVEDWLACAVGGRQPGETSRKRGGTGDDLVGHREGEALAEVFGRVRVAHCGGPCLDKGRGGVDGPAESRDRTYSERMV